ncbi:MAG: hypothetical protein HFG47_13470 [Lachnospiraceae bacterium]|nr:hypothetical protein [Lachnospiraceae bacterium]
MTIIKNVKEININPYSFSRVGPSLERGWGQGSSQVEFINRRNIYGNST